MPRSEKEIFASFPPFIRDYIYERGWESLHELQLWAADKVAFTDYNILLPSSTASGKTEAAFFPVLSDIYSHNESGIAVLYIAPLKSLINDQFGRISEITEAAGIPVFHWHGDVADSHKRKLLKNPAGILQITPESLESMLINRSADITRIFGNLKYVIIDEIHTLIGPDRGNQIMCQLCRINRAAMENPRRIGLSATIGDVRMAAEWLGAGSGRRTAAPNIPPVRVRWKLGIEHFYIHQDVTEDETETLMACTSEESESHRQSDGEYAQSLNSNGDFSFGKKNCYQNISDVMISGSEGESASECYNLDNRKSVNKKLSDAEMSDDRNKISLDAGYEYVYDCIRNKRAIVFSNSREETEYVTATLRQIAALRHETDNIMIHHGNLSSSIREEAEAKMKNSEEAVVVCATTTMELGIDIGKLERVVHVGAPQTVSSFLQRLGRSGRRGAPPEMMMVLREEYPLPNAPLVQLIPWELIRAIAVIQLFTEEYFIESYPAKKYPFSLLFHQTLSVLASSGGLTYPALRDRVLSLAPFSSIDDNVFGVLLASMLEGDFIEILDDGEYIVGLMGERLTSSFKFYAVFKDSEDFTVRAGSEEIGTISSAPPVNDHFALAGRVWEVEEVDVARRLIYVHEVEGKMTIGWPGDFGEVHTRILERMRGVLCEDKVYPYLKHDAVIRLEAARNVARNTGITERAIVCTGGDSWAFFPWLGTRSFRTLRRYMQSLCGQYHPDSFEYGGCYYMTFRLDYISGDELLRYMAEDVAEHGIDLEYIAGSNVPVFEKFDPYLPESLLKLQYISDRLSPDEVAVRLKGLADEAENKGIRTF